jgi:ADP-ribose pyrophosphatase YjhB (NUDIX family)
MAKKPVKESVAFYALDPKGAFLCVKRSDDDDSLPGVWGLPGASLREGETQENAVLRGARDKLGIKVKVERFVGDDTQDKGPYILHLCEYQVSILEGKPSTLNSDSATSSYEAVQWSSNPEVLLEAAKKGSSCSRIFLRNRGLWPSDQA